jgi:hypothetical protein
MVCIFAVFTARIIFSPVSRRKSDNCFDIILGMYVLPIVISLEWDILTTIRIYNAF